jgi:hypothetical protein
MWALPDGVVAACQHGPADEPAKVGLCRTTAGFRPPRILETGKDRFERTSLDPDVVTDGWGNGLVTE